MPGKRYLLDTNAVIALLAGHAGFAALADDDEWLGISVITALEFSGFAGLTEAERNLFREFCRRVEVVDLRFDDVELTGHVDALRRARTVKLPDAIILAAATARQAVLLTADEQLQRLNGALAGLEVRAFAEL